jgi:hypothetical protein
MQNRTAKVPSARPDLGGEGFGAQAIPLASRAAGFFGAFSVFLPQNRFSW